MDINDYQTAITTAESIYEFLLTSAPKIKHYQKPGLEISLKFIKAYTNSLKQRKFIAEKKINEAIN